MNKDLYQKWEPVDSIPKTIYCEAIHDDIEGFRILLRPEGRNSATLRILFDYTLVYRNIDESNYSKTLGSIKDREIFPLYIVRNSSWIDWFNEQNYGLYKKRNINVLHFSIISLNDCIDILSDHQPEVKWLNE